MDFHFQKILLFSARAPSTHAGHSKVLKQTIKVFLNIMFCRRTFRRILLPLLPNGTSRQKQSNLTHCGRVTQICVFTLQLCRTGDADLLFYVTSVQDGWRRFAFLRYNCAGRVTQICIFTLQPCRTGDADLLF